MHVVLIFKLKKFLNNQAWYIGKIPRRNSFVLVENLENFWLGFGH